MTTAFYKQRHINTFKIPAFRFNTRNISLDNQNRENQVRMQQGISMRNGPDGIIKAPSGRL